MNGSQVWLARGDVIILSLLTSPAVAGMYVAAASLSHLTLFFIQAGNAVVAVRFAKLHVRNDSAGIQRFLSQSSGLFVALSAPGFFVLLFWGDPLLSLYGDGFRAANAALSILIVGQASVVLGGSLGHLLSMTDNERYASRTLVFVSVLSVFLLVTLIPAYGLIGAALASTTTQIIRTGLLAFFVWRNLRILPTPFGHRLSLLRSLQKKRELP